MKPKFHFLLKVTTAIPMVIALTLSCACAVDQTYLETSFFNTWETTNLNWDAGVVWTNGNTAIFGGTGESVTVSTVTANGITINSADYNLTGGTITLGGISPTITTNASATISSIIAGSAGLTKSGAGSLTLSGTNTYIGGTSITAGTVTISNASGLSAGNATVGASGTLNIAGGGSDLTNINSIVNNGILNMTGTAQTRLNGTTLTGTGTLNINNTGGGKTNLNSTGTVMSGGTINIASGATVYDNTVHTVAANINILGSGNTENRGAIRFGVASTYTGNMSLQGNTTLGWDNAGTAAAAATISGGISTGVAGTSTLTLGAANNSTGAFNISGAITDGTGTLALTMVRPGTVALSGTNNYSGATTISSGKLQITSAGSVSNSAITVNNAGTLQVDTTGKTLNALTLASGSTLTLPAISSQTTTVSGPLTLTGTPAFTVSPVFGSMPAVGTYDLLTVGSVSGTPGTITTGGVLANSRVTASTSLTGNLLQLNVSAANSQAKTWNLSGNGTWDLGTTANFTGGSDNLFKNLDSVTFNSAVTPGVITLSGTLFPSSVTVANTSGTYTFQTGSIAGYGTLTMSGAGGTLALNIANTFSGGTTITAGTVTAGNGNAFGTGSINLSGGTLNTGGQTLANPLVATAATSSNIRFGNNATLNGTLTGSGSLSLAATSASSLSLNGDMSGYSGAITLDTASGNITANTNSANTGSTAAAFTVNNGGTYSFTISRPTFNMGELAGTAGKITGGSTGTTLSVGALNTSSTYTGSLNDNGTGILALTKVGTGTLTLSGTSTYTGATTVNGGKLAILTSRTNYNGPMSISAGILEFGGACQLNSGSYSQAITNNGTLIFNSSAPQSLSGVISGSGGLTKSGAGTLTLAAVNTYTGPTSVSGGTLEINGSGQLDAASAVSVNSGGTLRGSGIVNGNVTVNNGGALAGGTGGSGTLSMGSLTFAATATVNIGTLENYISFASLESYGNLTLSGGSGSVTINMPTTAVPEGSYHLISSANTLPNASQFAIGTHPVLGTRQSGSLVVNGGFVDYVVTGTNPSWTGAASDEWSTAIIAEPKNWITNVTTDYIAGDAVIFDDTATGATAVTLPTTVTPSSVLFNNSSQNYSLSGAGQISGATTILAKTGTGSVTLNTANSYGGGTVLNGGALILGNAAALGSSNITLGGGALGGTGTVSGVVSGGALTIDSAGGIITLTGVNTFTGATTVTAGTLEIGGSGQLGSGTYIQAITNNGTLAYNSSANQTISGSISGTGALTKSNSGTLSLSVTNTFSGGTTINAGILNLSGGGGGSGTIRGIATINTGGTLRLSTGDATGYNGGAGRLNTINIVGGTLDLNSTSNQTLGSATINMTGGAITGIAGSNLDFFGGGSALNTLASATTSTISGVTLSPLRQGNTTFTVADGAVAIDLAISSVIRTSPAGDGGTSVLTKAGTGTLSLSAVNTFNRPVAITGGTLEISAAGQLGSGTFSQAVTNNGSLAYNSTASQTLSGIISGSGNLTKSNSGGLTLGGVNTYTGNTVANAGTLTLAASAQLTFAIGTTSGTANSISGAGTVILNGNFAIDTTAASALSSGAWTLENLPSLTGPYGTSFTVVGFVDAGSDKWTKTEGSKIWSFDETTGVLTLNSSASYTSWIDGFTFAPGADKTATGDPDNDGINNATEMVLGGNPAIGMDAALVPTGTLLTTDLGAGSKNYLLFTFRRTDLSVTAGLTSNVQYGSNLSGWTTAIDGAGGVVIQMDDNYFTPASPSTDRVRVYIPRDSNTKLFGRLDITVP